jgi:hypothetical protein
MLFPFFPTEQLAFFLLETLVNENDQSVLLKAEAVLLSFPSAVLTKVMWRVVKSETGKLQHRALVILASLSSGDVKLTHYLLRKLRDEENPKQILPILEALGITENPRAVPMIEPHVKGNPVLAYTAIRSLVKIWVHHHDAVPIATYLEDPEITPLFKQTILKQMLKTGESQLYADTMQPCLVQFLDHENLNIRYLSAQVLAPVPSKDIAEQFFRLLLKEDDMTFTQFLRKSIQSQLTDHPAWMAALVHNHLESKESIRFLFAIIQESKLIGTKLVQLLLSLLAPPVLLHQSLHKDMLQSYLAAVLFQRKMDVAPLMRGMVELPGKDIVVRMLADILRSYPGISFDISVDQLIGWFDEDNAELKSAIIELLSLSKNHQSIAFLVSLVCRDDTQAYQQTAAQGLAVLMKELQ